jgi:hypothetical protein
MTRAGEVMDARFSTKVVQDVHVSPGDNVDNVMS